MLYGIAQVHWIRYPDKIFPTSNELSGVFQKFVTEKYLTLTNLL